MKNSNKKAIEKMQSEIILNNGYSIKNKYLVTVFILKVDSEGNKCNENLQYVFDDGTLIEKRRNAIKKAKRIMDFLNNTTGKEKFMSPTEVKKFKNFKCYSVDIFLIKEYENDDFVYDYPIYGQGEITYESLEVEAKFFNEMYDYQEVTKIETPDGETIEVLKESLPFFLLSLV
jgi:hypothetical protein